MHVYFNLKPFFCTLIKYDFFSDNRTHYLKNAVLFVYMVFCPKYIDICPTC